MPAQIIGNMLLAAFVSIATGSGFPLPQAQSDSRGESTVMLEYRVLTSLAIDGDAPLKFQAFMHVYENQPELNSELDVAMKFLREAASAGFPEAEYMLGYVLVRDQIVERNVDEGITWLRKAATRGHSVAAFWLGMHHLESYYVVSKKSKKRTAFDEATSWLEKAIDTEVGNSELSLTARTALGRLYIAESFRDARGWKHLMSAADVNHEPARNSLISLRRVLEGYRDAGVTDVASRLETLNKYLDEDTSKLKGGQL